MARNSGVKSKHGGEASEIISSAGKQWRGINEAKAGMRRGIKRKRSEMAGEAVWRHQQRK